MAGHVELPDDILHLLCAELAEQRDFDTLYACSVSSKRLAIPALTALYRYVYLHSAAASNAHKLIVHNMLLP